MTLAQSIKNGQTLRLKSGPLAIARNDLVALGGAPLQLYSVQNADAAAVQNAGGAVIPTTTMIASGAGNPDTREKVVLDPDTLDLFFAAGVSTVAIWKFNSAGALLRSVTLDTGGGGSTATVMTRMLTNGNILVAWWFSGTPYGIYFAIVDKNLNTVVAKTLLGNGVANPSPRMHCCPIDGGGFAFAYTIGGAGQYFGIRDAAGGVVYGPAIIAGTPVPSTANQAGARHRLARLSNGNIFVGVHDSALSDPARYCIFSPTGAVVKAFTVLAGYGSAFDGAGSGSAGYPEVEVVNGFACMALGSQRAYVFNNAGTLQGVPTPVASGNSPVRVKSDGTYFWAFSPGQVDRIATNGSKVTTTGLGFADIAGDVLYERGQFVVFDGTKAHVTISDAAGNASVAGTGTTSAAAQIIGLGDFSAVMASAGAYSVTKYLSASIVGIAQNDVAAGNAGALVSVNPGPGAYPMNEVRGTPGKTFDHSAAAISGCKGVLYANSVNLKGL
jgi:hypothetical protein